MKPTPPKAKPISEAQWQNLVIQMAYAHGWLVHHSRPSMNSRGRWSTAIQGHPGLPDLILCHEKTGQVIFAELKTEKGILSPVQTRWINALACSVHGVCIWRPSEFEQIRARLARTR